MFTFLSVDGISVGSVVHYHTLPVSQCLAEDIIRTLGIPGFHCDFHIVKGYEHTVLSAGMPGVLTPKKRARLG